MKNFWQKYPKPIIALAPLAGYTDSSFRQMIRSINNNVIVWTELISINGINFKDVKTNQYLRFKKSEKPLIIQLFGNNPEYFKKACQLINNLNPTGIDINMGCPAKKVIKNKYGSALMKNPLLACKIVENCVNSTKLPVSVKIRLGWDSAKELNSFGKSLENAGASLITVHGRTYTKGFSGTVNFAPIYELKEKLNIPVIGNGDIQSINDGLEKLNNLDGFMIGRAALSNPFIFHQDPQKRQASFIQKLPFIQKHCIKAIQLYGQNKGLLEMRKFLLFYVKDFPNAKKIRTKLSTVKNLKEVEAILANLQLS